MTAGARRLLLHASRSRVGEGSATASRSPPFGSPSVTFSLPELTHDGGIIYPFAHPCRRRTEGVPWVSGENREVRGHDPYRRGQTGQSALRSDVATGPGASFARS